MHILSVGQYVYGVDLMRESFERVPKKEIDLGVTKDLFLFSFSLCDRVNINNFSPDEKKEERRHLFSHIAIFL